MSIVQVQSLRKQYGSQVVLDGVSLDVAAGEVVAIIGRSGSGKSTLLRCINGLETLDSGSITVAGHQVSQRATRACAPCAKTSAWCSRASTCSRI